MNVILLGKQGIISPQIINHEIFIKTYGKALGYKVHNNVIEPHEENFQFILDIAELKVFTVNNKIFFNISVPLLIDLEWDIAQVYAIPKKIGNAFLAPLIEHRIFLTSGLTYINADQEYLEKRCKSKMNLLMCKQTQPIHDRKTRHDCASEIINFEIINSVQTCKYVVYKIEEILYRLERKINS